MKRKMENHINAMATVETAVDTADEKYTVRVQIFVYHDVQKAE